MADVLSDERIAAKLEGLEWKREGQPIVRDWTLSDFAEAWRSASTRLRERHPQRYVIGMIACALGMSTHTT
jgi:hypothetical protein